MCCSEEVLTCEMVGAFFFLGKEEYALKTRKKIEVQDNAC